MRKGRFVINETVADIDCLTGLNWSVDIKNIVSIRWSWPRNGGITLAAVFFAERPNDSLEHLLDENEPVIITKDMDKNYTRPLGAAWRAYRVFPAYFGEGSDIVILKQEIGTATDVIIKAVSVKYKIEYKPLPLSEYRRVNIFFTCSDTLPKGCALAYAKYRDGARICEYSLGRSDGAYICYLKKNEDIKFYAPEEYRANVLLFQEKS